MTLSSTTIKDTFNGDGVTDDFPTTFVFWNSSELEVILVSSSGNETTWTEGSEYTVTGGLGSAGTIVGTSSNAPASGTMLLVKSNLRNIQETSLPAGGVFPSTSVEQEMDRTVRRIQQLTEELERTIQLVEASTFSGITFPTPEAGLGIKWSTSLNSFENVTLTASTNITVPVVVAQGGTGSSTAAGARTNLGVAIGTDVQAYDATLDNLAALDMTRGEILYHDGSSIVALPVGSSNDGMILTSAGSSADPLWAAAAASTAAVPSQATQSAVELETNEDTYVPPDLLRHHLGSAKGWVMANVNGTADYAHNVTSTSDDSVGQATINWNDDFSFASYCAVGTIQGSSAEDVYWNITDLTAGATTMQCRDHIDDNLIDPTHYMIAVFGDQ